MPPKISLFPGFIGAGVNFAGHLLKTGAGLVQGGVGFAADLVNSTTSGASYGASSYVNDGSNRSFQPKTRKHPCRTPFSERLDKLTPDAHKRLCDLRRKNRNSSIFVIQNFVQLRKSLEENPLSSAPYAVVEMQNGMLELRTAQSARGLFHDNMLLHGESVVAAGVLAIHGFGRDIFINLSNHRTAPYPTGFKRAIALYSNDHPQLGAQHSIAVTSGLERALPFLNRIFPNAKISVSDL